MVSGGFGWSQVLSITVSRYHSEGGSLLKTNEVHK